MTGPPPTRPSLLARIRNPRDGVAWSEFVDVYGPLVYDYGRCRGLQDADAADLTQEVFLAVARAAGQWRYDPRQGSFRAWLYGVTRNKIGKHLQRRRVHQLAGGDSATHRRLAEEPSPGPEAEAQWEQEFQQQLFRVAADQIRHRFSEKTWSAFWRTAVDGASGAEVAAELRLSVGAVYVARSRVLARLTEQIRQLQAE
jgi:RNA polymerase sigma factor (sigma-70 family)